MKSGHLALVKEAGSTRSREGCGNKLHDEKYIDPWTVKRVLEIGLSVEAGMQGRRTRKRTIATSALKPSNDGRDIDGHHHRLGKPGSGKAGFQSSRNPLGGVSEFGAVIYR